MAPLFERFPASQTVNRPQIHLRFLAKIVYWDQTPWNPIKSSPLQVGGRCWIPRFSRGPQGQAPKKSLVNQCLLSRIGCYLLQNQEPSTENNPDKENSCFLQNQYPHMWKHQKKTCWFFLGKNLQDDSVEICVRVDSVEIFFVFDFVAWMCLQILQVLHVGQKGFQGNYPLQNQGHSLLPSLTTT